MRLPELDQKTASETLSQVKEHTSMYLEGQRRSSNCKLSIFWHGTFEQLLIQEIIAERIL
ncbi:hypothetical protein EV13_0167 [Prochlorococcus sp. MIT 0702]|nr:hypothetical protein EV13_0167 [Prochlorococcus sp. MIT 0702]